MKNWKGDTVKPRYEVALKQHVKGDTADDYESVGYIGADNYREACKIAKDSLKTSASTATAGFTKQNAWMPVLQWCLSAATLLMTLRITTRFGKRIMSTAKRLTDISFNKET